MSNFLQNRAPIKEDIPGKMVKKPKIDKKIGKIKSKSRVPSHVLCIISDFGTPHQGGYSRECPPKNDEIAHQGGYSRKIGLKMAIFKKSKISILAFLNPTSRRIFPENGPFFVFFS